ncbi:BQ5605_C008g05350 [Microbotryum silenes-dioicae]|uniref:BQ5605_C008g05350 protein n=1 Tax=Microbotryum silenes-dioicae TaxID=796604 RepID=A0A2X0MGZ5_9BASI|nr:BQ5605_C008g05350 [Microbotryum silenes-dioicae]
MRSSTTILLVVLSTWAFIGIQALDVVYPTAPVVFDQSGAIENRIVWSLTPLTNPPPATNFFDIWMRNGIGEIYPDALNVLIASNLDMTNPNVTYVWPDAAKYVPGPGYQLFFTAPGNASLVYCDSKVFSIGSTTYDASHTTYTGPSVELQPSSTSPASATEPATETVTGSATSPAVMLTTTSSAAQVAETTTVTNTLSASPTPTTVIESSFITSMIPASAKTTATPPSASVVLANSKPSSSSRPVATDYAGPAGQGFNLFSSSGMSLNVRRAGMGSLVVAMTAFIVA